jgi:hypothetical protein
LAGIPEGYTDEVVFTLADEDRASFVASESCQADQARLTCDGILDGDVMFRLQATDAKRDTLVTISVAPLAGHEDEDDAANNNSGPTTLQAVPGPADTPLAFGADYPRAFLGDRNEFLVAATVTGIDSSAAQPDGTWMVSFRLPDSEQRFRQLPLTKGCFFVDEHTMDCVVASGTNTLEVVFWARLPGFPNGANTLTAVAGPDPDDAVEAPIINALPDDQ